MDSWLDLLQTSCGPGGGAGTQSLAAAHSDIEGEFRALDGGCAIVDRSCRALLEVTGDDRATWLHNLTTNHVKTLQSGEGNAAYACNAQGRILFDLNVLVREEAILVELDFGVLEAAKAHFDKYKIIEDVTVADRIDGIARIGLCGAEVPTVLADLGAFHAGNLPQLGTSIVRMGAIEVGFVRTDFCGPFGVELFAPANMAVELWQDLVDGKFGKPFTPVGDEAVQIRRIEAGIPSTGREIGDEYLPAEVGDLDRTVSFNKGCYLGQEVIERMRSRGVVARKLVGIQLAGDEVPPSGAVLSREEKPVGTVTSACRSLALGAVVCLGYIKSSSSAEGTPLIASWDESLAEAVVVELPLVGSGMG